MTTQEDNLKEHIATANYAFNKNRLALEQILYKHVTSFKAVNYEELVDELETFFNQREVEAVDDMYQNLSSEASIYHEQGHTYNYEVAMKSYVAQLQSKSSNEDVREGLHE